MQTLIEVAGTSPVHHFNTRARHNWSTVVVPPSPSTIKRFFSLEGERFILQTRFSQAKGDPLGLLRLRGAQLRGRGTAELAGQRLHRALGTPRHWLPRARAIRMLRTTKDRLPPAQGLGVRGTSGASLPRALATRVPGVRGQKGAWLCSLPPSLPGASTGRHRRLCHVRHQLFPGPAEVFHGKCPGSPCGSPGRGRACFRGMLPAA